MTSRFLLSTLAIASLSFATPLYAGTDHDHGDGHGHDHSHAHETPVATPQDGKTSWKLLQDTVAEIDTLIAAKNLAPVHGLTEKLEAGTDGLQKDTARVAADKKTKLESALKQLNQSVEGLHVASEGKDAAKVESALKKVKSALKLVKSLHPAAA